MFKIICPVLPVNNRVKRKKGHIPKVTWRYKKPKAAGRSLLLRKVHLFPPIAQQTSIWCVYYIRNSPFLDIFRKWSDIGKHYPSFGFMPAPYVTEWPTALQTNPRIFCCDNLVIISFKTGCFAHCQSALSLNKPTHEFFGSLRRGLQDS